MSNWNDFAQRSLAAYATKEAEKKRMKKLFISCPMKGRTEEAIRESIEKMHKIAEIYEGEELEVIESYVPEHCPKDCRDRRLWHLGEGIKKMADADVFIGPRYPDEQVWPGCWVESRVAAYYGIKSYCVDIHDLAPDIVEIERNAYRDHVTAPPEVEK